MPPANTADVIAMWKLVFRRVCQLFLVILIELMEKKASVMSAFNRFVYSSNNKSDSNIIENCVLTTVWQQFARPFLLVFLAVFIFSKVREIPVMQYIGDDDGEETQE